MHLLLLLLILLGFKIICIIDRNHLVIGTLFRLFLFCGDISALIIYPTIFGNFWLLAHLVIGSLPDASGRSFFLDF